VWLRPDEPHRLEAVLRDAPAVRWVQLPWAGVEEFAGSGLFADGRQWTSGKGVYAEPVAEHALALALAGLRGLPARVDATEWGPPWGTSLYDAPVTVVGGGGIAAALVGLLSPFRTRVTVVRRRPEPFPGATTTVRPEALSDALRAADVVFLVLALTPDTVGIIGEAELGAMADHAWLVNVGRGAHVDTPALVEALRSGAIGGAALDVTEPEPLPAGHPLWTMPNCIITPHTANTPEMARRLLGARIAENVRRFAAGDDLVGVVDPAAGY
jgi:phosphoglycerate dehydrogenase-like enzyme